ncbi:MAG: BlaI/MecI/CopY family transcriptional regulator [Candidatus Bathyarchaeota archaeon]|nr:BlaI/MecI/CopY family transcriptional regulator [Candidatus Bathyarchaeota archaeon]
MANWEYDTSQTGLRTILKDHEELAMRIVWENPDGVNSRAVWMGVNARRAEPISRATVINFLERMREAGIVGGVEVTGKGGHHWVYSPAMNEAEFRRTVANGIRESIKKNLEA